MIDVLYANVNNEVSFFVFFLRMYSQFIDVHVWLSENTLYLF